MAAVSAAVTLSVAPRRGGRGAGRDVGAVAAAGGEVVPLTRRVAGTVAGRLTGAAALVGVAVAGQAVRLPSDAWLLAGYLLLTGALSALVLTPSRRAGLAGLDLALLVDAVAAQAAYYRLGPALGTGLAIAALLGSVCLLASFRAGVRLALWQTLLFVLQDAAISSGSLAVPQWYDDAHHTVQLASQLGLLWAGVIATASAAAISERELRRRRHDAEAVRHYAADLHRDETEDEVVQRLLGFAVEAMDVRRAVVVRGRPGRLRLVASAGEGVAVPPGPGRSTLLEGTAPGSLALARRLDPGTEAWLAAMLPRAWRLVVLALEVGAQGSSAAGTQQRRPVDPAEDATAGPDPDEQGVWLLFEHRGRGTRVERRVVATAAQVAATTGLALSRARLLRRVRDAALRDGLTGLANRRRLDQVLGRLGAGAFAVVLVDIDHFKQVNDTHGHQVGDEVLHRVGALLAEPIREGTMVARYGGEEFLVLLTGCDLDGAVAVAQRLRASVETRSGPVPVTASLGVAAGVLGAGAGADPDRRVVATIAAADAALYRAKAGGRNRVEVAELPDPQPASER